MFFGENNIGYLAVPTSYKTGMVRTVAFNFENPFIFDAPSIGRHKTGKHLSPYLSFVHVGKLLVNQDSLLG